MNFEELTEKISADDLLFLVLQAKEKYTALDKKTLPKMQLELKQFIKKLSIKQASIEDSIEGNYEYGDTDSVMELLSDGDTFLRYAAYQLRKSTENIYDYSAYLSDKEASEYTYNKLDRDVEGIVSEFTDTNIFVKLPLLNSRKTADEMKKKGHTAIENFYGSAVKRSLIFSETYHKFHVEYYPKYEIFYLFVYNDRVPQIDNDNYATRDITNAIASIFGAADAPWACSFRYNSVCSSAVPEGTYVTVSRQTEPISESAVLDFWVK